MPRPCWPSWLIPSVTRDGERTAVSDFAPRYSLNPANENKDNEITIANYFTIIIMVIVAKVVIVVVVILVKITR